MTEEAAKKELYTFILVFQNWAKNTRDDRDCVVPPAFVEGLQQYLEPFPVIPGLDQRTMNQISNGLDQGMADMVKKIYQYTGKKMDGTIIERFYYSDSNFNLVNFKKCEKIQAYRAICERINENEYPYDSDDTEYDPDVDFSVDEVDEQVIKKLYEYYLRRFFEIFGELSWVSRAMSEEDKKNILLKPGASNMVDFYEHLYILKNLRTKL